MFTVMAILTKNCARVVGLKISPLVLPLGVIWFLVLIPVGVNPSLGLRRTLLVITPLSRISVFFIFFLFIFRVRRITLIILII